VVRDEIALDLSGAAAGRYRLGVGMVKAGSPDRAPVVDARGNALPSGRLVLESIVMVP
jgi:hypothetical protein